VKLLRYAEGISEKVAKERGGEEEVSVERITRRR